jgi:transcriptional regulator with XRE-family HTH domain
LRFEDRSIRDFAIRVRQLRTERGLSQEKLAEGAGIHRTYLGGIELGLRNPSLRNIARIAHALDVTIVELFR